MSGDNENVETALSRAEARTAHESERKRGRHRDVVYRRRLASGDSDAPEELIEKLVHINRVSKAVKGGKRFGFAALVVVGDGRGSAGFGHGKAREVPEAISKATAAAKKAMVRVPLKEGRTLHHDGLGHFGAGKVTVRSAPAGTGIIAGGPMRAVFESLGVADVVTKSNGTSNPYSMIRATFAALTNQTGPEQIKARRPKKGVPRVEAATTSPATTIPENQETLAEDELLAEAVKIVRKGYEKSLGKLGAHSAYLREKIGLAMERADVQQG